jgi:hypothetical protein
VASGPANAGESYPATAEAAPPARTPAAGAAIPSVLNRMIRLVRVDRSESGGVVTLKIQAKAQVGERELDIAAVAICVQFAERGDNGQNVAWRNPIWLQIPAWENFKNKIFTVRFPGAPHDLTGFSVRTYYRGQLQDVAMAPTSVPPPPNPVPKGGS